MAPTPIFENISTSLNTPLLELGDVVVTPFFLVKAALILLVIIVAAALMRRRIVFRLMAKSAVDDGVKYALARIAGYGVWIVGGLIGLPMLGVKISSLLVAFGAIGIGIGLGLQKIAENFVSGMIILFSRPVKVGDRIRVGDTEGTVVEIQNRVTQVRTNDNLIVLVPNAHLVSDTVVNLTHNDKLVRYAFDVGVSYDSDPNTVRDCLLEVARAHEAIVETPEPDVVFRGFGDSSLDFRLRAYSNERVHVPETLLSEINFAIWYRLAEAGIKIPFPQRDLHIKTTPAEGLGVAAG